MAIVGGYFWWASQLFPKTLHRRKGLTFGNTPKKDSTDIDHQLTIAQYNACGFQGDVSLCSRCWFCQHPSTPAGGTRSFRFANVSFQWCSLGLIWTAFLNLSIVSMFLLVLYRNSQTWLKPYQDKTQLNNILHIFLLRNLDQQPTVSAILGRVVLHSDLRMDPLKIIGTPWMNLITRLETIIRVTKKKENLPLGSIGGSGGERGADCRSFTFQLASLKFWNLNMPIFRYRFC